MQRSLIQPSEQQTGNTQSQRTTSLRNNQRPGLSSVLRHLNGSSSQLEIPPDCPDPHNAQKGDMATADPRKLSYPIELLVSPFLALVDRLPLMVQLRR